MKKFCTIALLLSVMVVFLIPGFSTVEAGDKVKVYKWDMTYPLYRGTWDWKVLEKWCADLKKASGGRLILTPMAGGEIMPTMETFDAVSTGTLKIDFSYGPYWIGKLPMAVYASGLPPFTLPSLENFRVLYHELGLKEIVRRAYAKHNIFYVGAIPSNNAVLLSKKPVNTAADFKGMKLRATGLYAEVMNTAGASATYFPWGEIYGSLEKGVIDGVIAGPLSSQADSGFHEPTKYLLDTPITPVDAWSLHVNMDEWKSLPEDLQQLLIQSTSYASDIFTGSYFVHDVQYREQIAKKGFTFTSLSEKDQLEMRKHSLAVLDKYSAKDPDFAEATKILKKYMADLGLLE
ncbi:MAG: TRAP transporter substrate-binding protein DctP [Desulfobacula sp.]|jgi:TRAP-type mannitol/chloroaromatic compound transport system substrate-binding protein|nr:TRAP transporter substrate-binding protein DctP [Desulfobacula sp.]